MGFSRWLVLSGLAVVAILAVRPHRGGPAGGPDVAVPSWAHVAPEQIAEASKLGVPVAFENSLGMRFVLIPAGTFTMGSPEIEEERFEDEKQRQVTIAGPYYVQATEVTNREFRAYLPGHASGAYEGRSLDGDLQPVVNVSWKPAQDFAAWLSGRDGKRTYALPTEEQWERACRAGTTTPYSWGANAGIGWRYANAYDPVTQREFGWQGAAWEEDDGYRVTAPVASYGPNPWGLYDVHGNVFEYCLDIHDDPGEWVDGYDGPCPVVRGGSWREPPDGTRSAYRDSDRADRGVDWIGFRLVSPLPASR